MNWNDFSKESLGISYALPFGGGVLRAPQFGDYPFTDFERCLMVVSGETPSDWAERLRSFSPPESPRTPEEIRAMVEMVYRWKAMDPAKTFRPVPSDAPDARSLSDLCERAGGWFPSGHSGYSFPDKESVDTFREAVEGVWEDWAVEAKWTGSEWVAVVVRRPSVPSDPSSPTDPSDPSDPTCKTPDAE